LRNVAAKVDQTDIVLTNKSSVTPLLRSYLSAEGRDRSFADNRSSGEEMKDPVFSATVERCDGRICMVPDIITATPDF
jgi:hypothetical protein